MSKSMRALPKDKKLALIRAHPDLAGRLALAKKLTADSRQEQASAGLDRLTPSELKTFTASNAAYVKRFGFPFIMAIKGRAKAEILAAFKSRLANPPNQEFAAALEQIDRIALLRLQDKLPPGRISF